VLVVDDNPTARHVLGEMAKSLGWQVDLASGGAAALELVQRRRDAGKPALSGGFCRLADARYGWLGDHHATAGWAPDDHNPIIVMVTANGREMLGQRSTQEQDRA
jgi:CheY-like chemotaxis protein